MEKFDFTFLGNSQNYSKIMQSALAIAPYSNVTMMIRVHKTDISAAGSKFEVKLFDVDPSDQDGADFVIATPFFTSPSVTNATSAPSLIKDAGVGAVPGPYVRVVLYGEQGAAAGRLVATLSVDLLLRSKI